MARAKKVVKVGPTKRELWAAIWNAADAQANRDFIVACACAEDNAFDTFKDAGRKFIENDPEQAEEFAGYAYGSLSLTGHFADKPEVREFFEAAGYRW